MIIFHRCFILCLGAFGSYLLLSALIIVFLFLLVDGDIVKTFAKLKVFIENLRSKFKASIAEARERKEAALAEESKRKPSREEKKSIFKRREKEEEHVIKDTKINRPEAETVTREEKPIVKKEIPLESEDVREVKPKPPVVKPNTPKEPVGESASTEEPDIINEQLEDYKFPGLDLLEEPLREDLEGSLR